LARGFTLLAKAAEEPEFGPDSLTMLSKSGIILVTAGYVSPEQACGQTVDKRTGAMASSRTPLKAR